MLSNKRMPNLNYVTIPLGAEAKQVARRFAEQHEAPAQQQTVYRNTLAVYAVHLYLEWLDIPTDLEESQSWHLIDQALFDVADLVLVGLGRLECRPWGVGVVKAEIPPEAQADRIAYLAVELTELSTEARLLGFLPQVHPEVSQPLLSVEDLQSMDGLIEYLGNLAIATLDEAVPDQQMDIELSPQRVEQWRATLDRIFVGDAWHPVLRATVDTRGKSIRLCNWDLELVVSVIQCYLDVQFSLQIRRQHGRGYLPQGLQVNVVDEFDNILISQQVETAQSCNLIDLTRGQKLICESGDRFSVEFRLAEALVTESFQV